MLRASIDIGSNSILLLICNVENNKKIEVLENHSHVTGLGRKLDENKKFLDESMQDSLEVLIKYSEIIEKHKVLRENIVVTATEASRVATNSFEFYKKVVREANIHVSIISGEAEAYYSTIGILADEKIKDPEIVIMDIGGASTELIKVHCGKREILHSFSMPVGAVRMNNWEEKKAAKEELESIFNTFKSSLAKVSCSKLFCVAGTMTSVANMFLGHRDFIEHEVNGLELTTNNVIEMLEKFQKFSSNDFLQEYPFLGKRSMTIKSGLKLSTTIFKWLNIEELYISTYGLRYGTLLEGKIKDEFIIKQF